MGHVQGQCYGCHRNESPDGTPTAWSIRQLTPERIFESLAGRDHGGVKLTDIQKQRVAEFMSGRPMGSIGAGEASSMPNRCTANPPMRDPASGPSWNGWGNDLANTRFQPAAAARLTAADVSRLKLKWAFGFPKGVTNNAQPTVVSGRVFAGSDGYTYSLDAKTGCVYWSFQNGSIVRNSPMVGAVSGQGARGGRCSSATAMPTCSRSTQTGRQLWKTRGRSRRRAHHRRREVSRRARLRADLRLRGVQQRQQGLPCCTARGGVAALDANTGKEIWKTYLADPPKPWKKPANGAQLYGPATGGVWNSPTIDPVRGALYVGTGDAVTPPESPLTDAVIALDLKTGKLLWSHRATENDLFMGGCGGEQK